MTIRKVANKKIFVAGFVFVVFNFFFSGIVLAQTSAHTVIGQTDINALPQTTGAPVGVVQQISDTFNANVVKPEITVPANGGLFSGKNLLFKGIASPSSNIDILIQSLNQSVNSLNGKTTSDQYGVWSYNLSSELNPGSYSVVISSQSTNSAPLQSVPITFTIQADISTTANASAGIIQSLENQPLVIIILVIIFCLTLVVVTLIWAVVFYLRSVQRTRSIKAMNQWSVPALATINEEQWQEFTQNLENLHRNFYPLQTSQIKVSRPTQPLQLAQPFQEMQPVQPTQPIQQIQPVKSTETIKQAQTVKTYQPKARETTPKNLPVKIDN